MSNSPDCLAAPSVDHPVVLPDVSEVLLPTGLRVIAIQHGTVPITEVRLRIPCAAPRAEAVMLGRVMCRSPLARGELRQVGGQLSAGADADHVGVECAVLSDGTNDAFRQLAAFLSTPSWSAEATAEERQRLSAQLDRAGVALTGQARRSLLRRMFGDHRYAAEQPDSALVQGVTHDVLVDLHDAALRPAGATIVVVSSAPVDRVLDGALRWLADWSRPPLPRAHQDSAPVVARAAEITLTRPETAASAIRWGFPVVPRQHADHAALQIANLVFGGYFGSRLTEGLRERDGFVYNPRSVIEHKMQHSILMVSADIGGEPSSRIEQELCSVLMELAKHGPSTAELERARRYGVGMVKVGLQGQAAVANLVAVLAVADLTLDFLVDLIRDLGRVSAADVSRVCRTYLQPPATRTSDGADASDGDRKDGM